MNATSKSMMLSGVAICVVLAALAMAFVRGAVTQQGADSEEGYFSPVYSPDGQYVYFIERSSSGIVEPRITTDVFRPPEFDVLVTKDTFTLKRLHVKNGQIEGRVVQDREG